MRLPSSSTLMVASAAVAAQAQFLMTELSFGFGTRIHPEGTDSIPNFTLQGRPKRPELLSNKVILTPPVSGNHRGGIWSDKVLSHNSWISDVDFRANGPERGGGNLNIWLAKNGPRSVGSESVYTVGKFEGLVLVIDQHGGTGGMLRGFLNDGTTDYSHVHNVDALAFAHCNFAYRNLGRPSQVKMRHSERSFRVEIDSNLCFETDKVRIPAGYNLGITAASADKPDSFEVFKMVVLRDDGEVPPPLPDTQAQQPMGSVPDAARSNFGHQGGVGGTGTGAGAGGDPYVDEMPEVTPERITSTNAQFADLHNRLQGVNRHITSVSKQVTNLATVGEARHQEMSVILGELKGLMNKMDRLDRLGSMDAKMNDMEKELHTLRKELEDRLYDTVEHVKEHMNFRHEQTEDHVVAHAAPGHAWLIFTVFGSQLFLVLAYMLYKRRKASMPKKYL